VLLETVLRTKLRTNLRWSVRHLIVVALFCAHPFVQSLASATDRLLIMTISEYSRQPLLGVRHDADNALVTATAWRKTAYAVRAS
jgi:hypothetical protein